MRHLRNANKLPVSGLIRTAETHKDLFENKDFLASILVDSVEFGKIADVYSMLVGTKKWRVRVFNRNIDEPLSWIGYDNSDTGKLDRFMG